MDRIISFEGGQIEGDAYFDEVVRINEILNSINWNKIIDTDASETTNLRSLPHYIQNEMRKILEVVEGNWDYVDEQEREKMINEALNKELIRGIDVGDLKVKIMRFVEKVKDSEDGIFKFFEVGDELRSAVKDDIIKISDPDDHMVFPGYAEALVTVGKATDVFGLDVDEDPSFSANLENLMRGDFVYLFREGRVAAIVLGGEGGFDRFVDKIKELFTLGILNKERDRELLSECYTYLLRGKDINLDDERVEKIRRLLHVKKAERERHAKWAVTGMMKEFGERRRGDEYSNRVTELKGKFDWSDDELEGLAGVAIEEIVKKDILTAVEDAETVYEDFKGDLDKYLSSLLKIREVITLNSLDTVLPLIKEAVVQLLDSGFVDVGNVAELVRKYDIESAKPDEITAAAKRCLTVSIKKVIEYDLNSQVAVGMTDSKVREAFGLSEDDFDKIVEAGFERWIDKLLYNKIIAESKIANGYRFFASGGVDHSARASVYESGLGLEVEKMAKIASSRLGPFLESLDNEHKGDNGDELDKDFLFAKSFVEHFYDDGYFSGFDYFVLSKAESAVKQGFTGAYIYAECASSDRALFSDEAKAAAANLALEALGRGDSNIYRHICTAFDCRPDQRRLREVAEQVKSDAVDKGDAGLAHAMSNIVGDDSVTVTAEDRLHIEKVRFKKLLHGNIDRLGYRDINEGERRLSKPFVDSCYAQFMEELLSGGMIDRAVDFVEQVHSLSEHHFMDVVNRVLADQIEAGDSFKLMYQLFYFRGDKFRLTRTFISSNKVKLDNFAARVIARGQEDLSSEVIGERFKMIACTYDKFGMDLYSEDVARPLFVKATLIALRSSADFELSDASSMAPIVIRDYAFSLGNFCVEQDNEVQREAVVLRDQYLTAGNFNGAVKLTSVFRLPPPNDTKLDDLLTSAFRRQVDGVIAKMKAELECLGLSDERAEAAMERIAVNVKLNEAVGS